MLISIKPVYMYTLTTIHVLVFNGTGILKLFFFVILFNLTNDHNMYLSFTSDVITVNLYYMKSL